MTIPKILNHFRIHSPSRAAIYIFLVIGCYVSTTLFSRNTRSSTSPMQCELMHLNRRNSAYASFYEGRNNEDHPDFKSILKALNELGRQSTDCEMLESLLLDSEKRNSAKHVVINTIRTRIDTLRCKQPRDAINKFLQRKIHIALACVVCGDRRKEAMVMIKSAVLFSQDAHLHIIVASDQSTAVDVAIDILTMKFTMNVIGLDFTFEIHLEWFPSDSKVAWKNMFVPCATERLFFPSLLSQVDAVIYLDTDTIVLSNLTELWLEFGKNMKTDKMIAMAANNEDTATGWYRGNHKIPFYGINGLNAGVMLMNLTQMRSFNFEERALATHQVYHEKMELADQDIVNIIFHTFSEKLHKLDCSFNFNWVHCGNSGYKCHDDSTGSSFCFCNATYLKGVQIVHGNGRTFFKTDSNLFLNQLYVAFSNWDPLLDSPITLFESLMTKFKKLENPCHPLSAGILYNNALSYLKKLK